MCTCKDSHCETCNKPTAMQRELLEQMRDIDDKMKAKGYEFGVWLAHNHNFIGSAGMASSVRSLWARGWAEQDKVLKHYASIITPAGRAALER